MAGDEFGPGSYDVRIATPEEFGNSREIWNGLAASMRFPTPFSTWDWVYTWWQQFAVRHEILPLFIYREQQLRGILPLWRRPPDQISKRLGVVALEMCGVSTVYADHADMIGRPEDIFACTSAALDFLGGRGIEWDALRLPMLSEHSEMLSALHGVTLTRGLSLRQQPVGVAPFVAGNTSFEDFINTLSRNERYKLRSRCRKLLEGQNVEYVGFSYDERHAALGTLFRLHQRRAAEKGIVSSFVRPEVQSFHRMLVDRLDWEQVLFRALKRGDEVIAMFYGFRTGNRIFYFQLGHDPAWAKWSPGLVLITETIRESLASGSVEYNFLQGDEPFKRIWAQQARTLYDCYIYNATVRGGVARGLSKLKSRIRQTLRRSARMGASEVL